MSAAFLSRFSDRISVVGRDGSVVKGEVSGNGTVMASPGQLRSVGGGMSGGARSSANLHPALAASLTPARASGPAAAPPPPPPAPLPAAGATAAAQRRVTTKPTAAQLQELVVQETARFDRLSSSPSRVRNGPASPARAEPQPPPPDEGRSPARGGEGAAAVVRAPAIAVPVPPHGGWVGGDCGGAPSAQAAPPYQQQQDPWAARLRRSTQ